MILTLDEYRHLQNALDFAVSYYQERASESQQGHRPSAEDVAEPLAQANACGHSLTVNALCTFRSRLNAAGVLDDDSLRVPDRPHQAIGYVIVPASAELEAIRTACATGRGDAKRDQIRAFEKILQSDCPEPAQAPIPSRPRWRFLFI